MTHADMYSIVAVHGLNGHPFMSWTTETSKKMWLKDPSFLPSDLKNSRILTFGYNAKVEAIFGKATANHIRQHAHTLVAELNADRSVSLLSTTTVSRTATKSENSCKM